MNVTNKRCECFFGPGADRKIIRPIPQGLAPARKKIILVLLVLLLKLGVGSYFLPSGSKPPCYRNCTV